VKKTGLPGKKEKNHAKKKLAPYRFQQCPKGSREGPKIKGEKRNVRSNSSQTEQTLRRHAGQHLGAALSCIIKKRENRLKKKAVPNPVKG